GSVNIGQPELAEVPPPVTTLQLLQQPPEVMEIVNPVEATPASLARGEVMYDRACSPCHGAGGAGDGPVAQAGMPSFSLLTPQAMEYPDGYIYSIVRIGRGGMPPYAHQITNYDRWHIVNYVRQLQGADAEPAADTATPDQAEEQ
ncbi:MAG: cytochrome c, partial [Gemmatimonadota bacterium]